MSPITQNNPFAIMNAMNSAQSPAASTVALKASQLAKRVLMSTISMIATQSGMPNEHSPLDT